jgi:hypothetical protein
MSARVTFLAVAVLLGGMAAAAHAEVTIVVRQAPDYSGHPDCSHAIAEFDEIIDSDVRTGNLNRSVHTRIKGDLRTIRSGCKTGNGVDAMRQLSAVKHRYGYR